MTRKTIIAVIREDVFACMDIIVLVDCDFQFSPQGDVVIYRELIQGRDELDDEFELRCGLSVSYLMDLSAEFSINYCALHEVTIKEVQKHSEYDKNLDEFITYKLETSDPMDD